MHQKLVICCRPPVVPRRSPKPLSSGASTPGNQHKNDLFSMLRAPTPQPLEEEEEEEPIEAPIEKIVLTECGIVPNVATRIEDMEPHLITLMPPEHVNPKIIQQNDCILATILLFKHHFVKPIIRDIGSLLVTLSRQEIRDMYQGIPILPYLLSNLLCQQFTRKPP